jgi:16S rRNA (uracil1498-N3)-methyltransferase
MKLQRFFVKNKAKVGADLVVADSALSHQLGKVFRMSVGQSVILFDGDGFEYVSTVKSLRKDGAVFHIEESSPSIAAPSVILHLYPALIKKDKLEWVLQKATELGTASFHPVVAERSEKLGFDLKRAEKIIKEAAEQSGWGKVPEILPPEKLEMAIEQAENPVVLDGDVGAEKWDVFFTRKLASLKHSRSENVPHSPSNIKMQISMFVGPEGGWSKEEKEYFSARRIPTVSLGEQTLRAETASVAVSALLLGF